MTCAHIVNVALKKLSGVESVEVSLNKALATVKLKPGNTISVPQLWRLLRDKGYTPENDNRVCSRRPRGAPGRFATESLRNERLDPIGAGSRAIPRPGARPAAKVGQRQIVQGVMVPAKNLKMSVPLTVNQVK